MRILLVEDETDLGLALKQVLISEKYVVDWVTDGTQAWQYIENQWTDYTVAIIDWLIPKISVDSSGRSRKSGGRVRCGR
jgi:two-component system, OmpR family, Ni(II)-responsive and/or redox-responsive regulator NrsR